MRYMDELFGSLGEPCVVTNPRTNEKRSGVIAELHIEESRVTVAYDSGARALMPCEWVELVLSEDEADGLSPAAATQARENELDDALNGDLTCGEDCHF